MLSFKEKLEPKPCTKHALDTPWPHQPFRALKPTCWFSQTLWSPCIFKVLVKPNTPKKHGDLVVGYPLSHCLVVLQHFLSLVPQICLSNTNPSPPLWSRRERCKPVGVQITFCQGNKLCKPFPFGKGMASSKKATPCHSQLYMDPFVKGPKGPLDKGHLWLLVVLVLAGFGKTSVCQCSELFHLLFDFVGGCHCTYDVLLC